MTGRIRNGDIRLRMGAGMLLFVWENPPDELLVRKEEERRIRVKREISGIAAGNVMVESWQKTFDG